MTQIISGAKRMVNILHVAEILMGEQFQDHPGDSGGPGFAVRPVPQAPAAPGRVEASPDVIHYLALYKICVHPVLPPAFPVGKLVASLTKECVDGEGSYYRIIRRDSGIGMEGE